VVPTALRPLANAINLRYEDFTILEGTQAFVVGKKAFHAALWSSSPVTLALSADCNQLAGVGGELSQLTGGVSDVLNPVTEFCDLVPSYQLPLMPSTEVTLLQATISVLPRLQLETLQSIGAILKGKSQVLDKSNFNFRGSIPNLSGLKDGNGSLAGNLRNVVSVQNLSTLNEESSATSMGADDGSVNANAMPAFDDVMTREVGRDSCIMSKRNSGTHDGNFNLVPIDPIPTRVVGHKIPFLPTFGDRIPKESVSKSRSLTAPRNWATFKTASSCIVCIYYLYSICGSEGSWPLHPLLSANLLTPIAATNTKQEHE